MADQCIGGGTRIWRMVLASLGMSAGLLLPSSAEAEPFSLICMPDPQYYSTTGNTSNFDLYRRQTRWIRDNKNEYNIQHVIWLGDLTNDNTFAQWSNAAAAYTILDAAQVPFAVVPGNHDYKTNNSDGWIGANLRNLNFFNAVVGPQRFITKSWYGGNMGQTPDHNENNYTYFSSQGLDFLVVGLEYAPRKEVLTWANKLISDHPNHRVIIFTHSYMGGGGAYGGQAGSAAGTVGASGSEIFEECASRHSNVFMVVCGHVTESVYNSKTGVNGNRIYEMLVDYQSERALNKGGSLGNGWLRILEFDPDNNRINASTVTPAAGDDKIFLNGHTMLYQDAYMANPLDSDHRFTLPYNMGPTTEPYVYLNKSVSFHTMSLNNDLHSDQLDVDIGQADNGNWASVWEDDNDNNGIYQLLLRGFDPDGNVRFPKITANVTGVNSINAINPSMAMAPDGRFVIVWQSGTREIKMRSFNADGTPHGAVEQTVYSCPAPGTLDNPDVAIDAFGNFVVTWADDRSGLGVKQVKASRYSFNYVPLFTDLTVNTILTGQKYNPVIAMAANGDFVIAWEDVQGVYGDLGVRGFFANGTPRFAQITANTITDGEQNSPDIAMDNTGRFVIIWEDDADLNTFYQIKARGFKANGTHEFERVVNRLSDGNQINPAIAMDSASNWYAVWEDNGVTGSGYQMVSNVSDITGNYVDTADVRANTVHTVTHKYGPEVRKGPVISPHKSGRYIVAWADDMDGNGYFQSLAKGIPGMAKSLVVRATNGTVAKFPDDAFYRLNSTVKLTATPAPGYTFTRWVGDVPAGGATLNPLTVTMNTTKVIKAEFTGTSRVGEWQLY